MKVGFTGTQEGCSIAQTVRLTKVIENLAKDGALKEFHHGDCEGADATADVIARPTGCKMHIHPPINPAKRAFCGNPDFDVVHPMKEYLERNHDIVDACDTLIVCPKGMKEELRSGTWATYRYARKCGDKSIIIVYPDGSVG